MSRSAPLCGPFDVPLDPANVQSYGQCTYWVEEKRPDLLTNAVWKYKHTAVGGNAWDWEADAVDAGYLIDHLPRVGDVAAYPPGASLFTEANGTTWSAGPVGHVAYVEKVNPDGSFVVSEMNVVWPLHGDITLAPAANAATTYFIHLPGSVPAPPVVVEAPVVTLSTATKSVAENVKAIKVTVTRTGSTAGALTVAYSVKGTAVAGVHFAGLSGSVTIPDGGASATIRVKPKNDHSSDGTHTLKLALKAGDGYAVGSPASLKIKILNVD